MKNQGITRDYSCEYFNPEIETMTREQIEALQLEGLQETVRHCMHSEFYRKRFQEIGLEPGDIQCLDDLRKIPFTTKQDLRDTYPFGIASVPLEQCTRLHSSSGTTGNPTVILHTDKDRVFVKAKTGEKMGDVGKGLAVEVFASCLLEK